MYVDMGQGWPGSQTQTPITPCRHQKVVIPACRVQMTVWQLQFFSLLCPLSSLEYKDLADVGLLISSRLYRWLFSLNRAAAKTAVWSLSSGFCHQAGVTLALPELCAVGDTETSVVLEMKSALHIGPSITCTWAVHTHAMGQTLKPSSRVVWRVGKT